MTALPKGLGNGASPSSMPENTQSWQIPLDRSGQEKKHISAVLLVKGKNKVRQPRQRRKFPTLISKGVTERVHLRS